MNRFSLAVIAAAVVLQAAPAQTPRRQRQTVAEQADTPGQPQAERRPAAPAGNWIFARGRYTNDPKTGERVDQYQKVAPIYRIPNEEYYGAEGPHPFGPDYGYPSYYPHYLPYLHPFPYHLPYLYPQHPTLVLPTSVTPSRGAAAVPPALRP